MSGEGWAGWNGTWTSTSSVLEWSGVTVLVRSVTPPPPPLPPPPSLVLSGDETTAGVTDIAGTCPLMRGEGEGGTVVTETLVSEPDLDWTGMRVAVTKAGSRSSLLFDTGLSTGLRMTGGGVRDACLSVSRSDVCVACNV